MGGAKAKTINLLLYEGDLGGVISIEDSSWNSGELYSAPRKSVMELLDTGACNKYMSFKTIDLCAGIGGIRRGFELAGYFENVLS